MGRPRFQTLERIKSHCEEVGDCWIWSGSEDGRGRPVCCHNGRRRPVRRVARELADGKPVPAHMQTTSRCGDILCVSPHCSVVATPKTTHRLAVERGSYKHPDSDIRMTMNKRAKSHITDETVALIRASASSRTAHAETGVSLSHCKAIRRGSARRDLSSPFAGLFTRFASASNDGKRRAA